MVKKAAELLDQSLTLIATKSDEQDPQWYDHGVWRFRNCERNWPVQGGPATAAAVLWKWRQTRTPASTTAFTERQKWLHDVAVETFDRAVADHLNPEGYFDEDQTPATYFFATEMATTLWVLGDSLDNPHQAGWKHALERMFGYLIKSGNLPNPDATGWKATDGFYTNGNIELGEAELLFLLGKITGNSKYEDILELQWAHLLNPSRLRWPLFGLHVVAAANREFAIDGSGYLNEDGGKHVGFDGDYTHFALSVAARYYVLSRDPRLLRLMNMFANMLLPLTDDDWVLDATGGTRHSLRFPFTSSGLAVLSRYSGRADLTKRIVGQFDKAIYPSYHGNASQNWGSASLYRGYGCDLAVILLADLSEIPVRK